MTGPIDFAARDKEPIKIVPPPPKAPKSGGRPQEDGGKLRIELGPDMARVVDEAVDALRDDSDVYVFAGHLSRVVLSEGTEQSRRDMGRDAGASFIEPCNDEWIQERLSKLRSFISTRELKDGTKKKVTVQPPLWVAEHVRKRMTWPGYRLLIGVVTAPTLRRDGSLLQEPGYDPRSGLLYAPTVVFPPILDAPSRDDALAARDALLEVIDDFEIDDLCRSVWLALVFSLAARELVDGFVPMFAADSPARGAGKGLYLKTAHLIGTGSLPAHMSMPPTEEEMRKQVTTSILGGDPGIMIDNIGPNCVLGGDSLESVLTAEGWKTRLLGGHGSTGTLIPRAVWMAGGNGMSFTPDMARRTLRTRLIPTCERPEDRTDFKHPERAGVTALVNWVRSNRPRLVVAALTCLRAWITAGRPIHVKPMGSFENFSSTIAACVRWLADETVNLPDPKDAQASLDGSADTKRTALATVFAYLAKHSGGLRSAELVAYAFPADGIAAEEGLQEAIGELVGDRARDNRSRADALGRRLRAARGRVLDIDGKAHTLDSDDTRTGVMRWVVKCR